MVELLISSLVVGAAGALLIGGLVAANRSADWRIEQILTTQLLASRLALLDDSLSDTTLRSGIFPAPLDDFTWTLDIAGIDGPLAPLAQGTLTVTRKDHASHVVTYRPVAAPN